LRAAGAGRRVVNLAHRLKAQSRPRFINRDLSYAVPFCLRHNIPTFIPVNEGKIKIMTTKYRLAGYLGIAHALNDGCAAFLLVSLALTRPVEESALLFLLYNGLAFGGQILAGWLTDRYIGIYWATVAGLFLVGLAGCAGQWQATLAISLAGVGSALFHVGGGALLIQHEDTGALGIFTAPGVVGLAIGTGLATVNQHFALLLAGLIFAFAVGLVWLVPSQNIITGQKSPQFFRNVDLEWHWLFIGILLLAISLRSLIWTSFQAVYAGDYNFVFAMAIAAATGKVLGGFVAEKFGWQKTLIGSLGTAAILLSFNGQNQALVLMGILFLQSATPIGLALTAQALPKFPATATGLTLGVAIAIGGVLNRLISESYFYISLILLLLIFLLAKVARPINQHSRERRYQISHQRQQKSLPKS
jgi:MFS transporter, FSR family, fosmidomycin resistance protein